MNHYDKIAEALSYIQSQHKRQPELEEIAAHVHISPFHFQRLFSEWAGVSPKKFLQYLNVRYAKELLNNNSSMLSTAYQTGLSGSGRLHDLFVRLEGMTPGEYKNGGKDITISYSFGTSPFGNYLVASTSKGICNVLFYETDRAVAEKEIRLLWPQAELIRKEVPMHQLVQNFFDHTLKQHTRIPLHLKATPFQLKVWEALLQIPEGQLRSYSDIAAKVGKTQHRRAAGSAIAKNPVGFLIPCHRVIRSMGVIGQYRWGTTRKTAMIGWEGARTNP